jgi:hypothetical protein
MGKPHKKLADVEAALSAAVGDKEAKRVARFLIVK